MSAVIQDGLIVRVGATSSGKTSMLSDPQFVQSLRAAKQIRRIERHGSRKAKVLARRNRDLSVTEALTAIAKGLEV